MSYELYELTQIGCEEVYKNLPAEEGYDFFSEQDWMEF